MIFTYLEVAGNKTKPTATEIKLIIERAGKMRRESATGTPVIIINLNVHFQFEINTT